MNACVAIIVIFSDAVWHQPALQLASELASPGVCILHHMWSNSTCDYCWRTQSIPHTDSQSAQWGSRQYFARIKQRVPIVNQLAQSLPLDDNKWIGMFDADIVCHRNISARFSRIFRDTRSLAIVQQEWPCKMAPLQNCINGGLWAVRRSSGGVALLNKVERLMHQLRIPDQDAFDIAAAHQPVHYLDSSLYANGNIVQWDSTWSNRNAHLVHMNWLQTTACKLAWLAKVRANRFHSRPDYASLRKRCGV